MQKPTYIYRIGHILFASLFLISGLIKVSGFQAMINYMVALGLPAPTLTVLANIIIEVVGGLLLMFNIKIRLTAFFLATFTLIGTFAAYRFWEAEPAMFDIQLNNFLKNIAVTGTLLMLADKNKTK